MGILFIDTETTGLPNFGQPPSHPDQPLPIQVAAILTDDSGEQVQASFSTLIYHDGIDWPASAAAAQAVHGISEKRCNEFGMAAITTTDVLNVLFSRANRVVAHNAQFDAFMIDRLGALAWDDAQPAAGIEWYCTMRESADILKLPRKGNRQDFHEQQPGDYKMPKLAEAYRFFTGRDIEGAHNALVDAEACRQVYLGIQRYRAASARMTAPGKAIEHIKRA